MKRTLGIAIACLSFAAVLFLAHPARAELKIYANSDFKFQMSYPGDWKMIDESPSVEIGKSFGSLGGLAIKKDVNVGGSLGINNVCFTKKKCSSKYPHMKLMMIDSSKMPKGSKDKGKGDKNSAKSKKDIDDMEKSRPECDRIADGMPKRWAGRRCQISTLRCPEKKKWRYSTFATMTSGKKIFNLTCDVIVDEKD